MNACGSIQTAITTAETATYNGDDATINVAAGTYTENDTIAASSLNSLTIAGAGASFTTVNGNSAATVFIVNTGTVTISGVTIIDGVGTGAGQEGGAIFDNGATVTVTNSTLSNNTANYGGAIFNNGATVTVTDSTVSGNTAGQLGGGIDNEGLLTVTNSTLSDNSSPSFSGGGIENDGTATVTNSTLSGNSAGNTGGAIDNTFGNLTVTNSTLWGNSTGIDNASNPGTVNLGATVLANNGSGTNCSGTIVDEGYNLADDASCGLSGVSPYFDQPTTDPDLGSLQNNGGPTDTMALTAGSPAIDYVTSGSGLCPATDQRGAPRTAPCDIGAYDTDWGPAMHVERVRRPVRRREPQFQLHHERPGGDRVGDPHLHHGKRRDTPLQACPPAPTPSTARAVRDSLPPTRRTIPSSRAPTPG